MGHPESDLLGFPIACVLLDGLGDWASPALGGRTPLEAAPTPHLDALARAGASGLLYPLAPGRAPSSERGSGSISASALNAYLRHAHDVLDEHPVNDRRREEENLPLNVVVTKWSGRRHTLPPLEAHVGGRAAFVASRELYGGLAKVVSATSSTSPKGIRQRRCRPSSRGRRSSSPTATHSATCTRRPPTRPDTARTRSTSRRSSPHSTKPSPSVAVDSVSSYGERAAAGGGLGVLRGSDLLAVLVNLAGRARFLGSRHGTFPTLAAPLEPLLLDVPGADGTVAR